MVAFSKTLNQSIFLLIIIMISACGTKKNTTTKNKREKVKTKVDSKYKKYYRGYAGTLDASEYSEIIKLFEKELDTTLQTNKSILINFDQKAPRCISYDFDKESMHNYIENVLRISSDMSLKFNANDYFVYTEDSYGKEAYEKHEEYILDSGFFYDQIFTEHEICGGFIIIKPNGDFYKHFGEDYFSEVRAFFEEGVAEITE